ncbi:hypothetical protein BDW02DRAFT_573425 [Decorospora gaudefroyi]|uniref:Uncharacterized protein n=1 Tax=Decorospora gaudefroyi TaxID=184978 RepID=A0A6A5JYF1_9PLEO|nr:hypothetical protein BDW02DRAFT_573425 [Decorospora gaudefroyi]
MMDRASRSPVSSFQLASSAPRVTNNTTQTIVQDPDDRKGTWLPFTFRWYFILVPITVSLGFGIATILLVWYSQNYYGIGADNGSSAILFGWRFTPTLLAVLYTQMTVILFEDAKRTEPFVRLAEAPFEGASAHGTVLQTPRAWWAIFFDILLKRRSIGKTSWCLICSAFINILALFAISPLSSALLTSEEVVITRPVDFSRTVPKTGMQLPIVANREVYFKTMSALMRNVSTSAWITDDSLTLPFWPSTEGAQLGPDLVSKYNSWTVETTALYASLGCQEMTLESADLVPKGYYAYDVMGHGPYKGTQPMVVFILTSGNGCRYELSLHPMYDLVSNGGLTWSDASTLLTPGSSGVFPGVFPIHNNPFVPNITTGTSPVVRLNVSNECAGRDIIILNTPWTKAFTKKGPGPSFVDNKTFERSLDFRMKAQLCESHYHIEDRTVTVAMSASGETNITSAQNVDTRRNPVTNALVNVTEFGSLALLDSWKDYFSGASVAIESDSALGGYLDPDSDPKSTGTPPGFGGMGLLLAALYSFNITQMIDDERFADQAARVKGRFFTECLREALSNPKVVDTKLVQGNTTVIEARVMVLKEIGISLAVLFVVSFLLLLLVFTGSRLSRRPLNLKTDPGSTIGHAMLLRSQLARNSTFRSGHQTSHQDFRQTLRSDTFYTLNGSLYTGTSSRTNTIVPATSASSKNCWQPLVIRLRMLFALSCFLILILVAVLVLNAFSARSRLSQLAFTYQADVSKLGLSFATFAPISIVPTLVSIAVGLWWDQLDSTFRTLQPYIAMSRRPTPICKGAGLTYRSKTWAGAAIKAARNRHWMLFMVAIGSVLCQILTVSMSALFEQKTTNVSNPATLERTLEPRELPIITTVRTDSLSPDVPYWEVLNRLLMNPPKSWLPGAAIQLSFNGTKLPWTHDGWSFVPLDLSNIPSTTSTQLKAREGTVYPTNVTVTTSAIRARVECNQVPEAANVSAWLVHPEEDTFPYGETYNLEDPENYYRFRATIFDNTPSNTSVFATSTILRCCSNGTGDATQRAVIGHWSPVDAGGFPHADSQWPLPFVTKWIVGKPQYLKGSYSELGDSEVLLFKDIPDVQAARCMPIIEAVEATVTVDKDNGMVQSHGITGSVATAQSAWSEGLTRHSLTNGNAPEHYNETYIGPLNMTTSYGVLFMNSMFHAAAPDRLDKADWEQTSDNAFVMRDHERGINMDFMTYSMYSLADKDPEALLDYATLVAHADHTFQTFFQHFVSNGLTLDEGGLVYQKIGDDSVDGLGTPISYNGSALPRHTYARLQTNRTAEAWVSNRIQVLHMNSIATYLSVAIIIWLVGTTAVITCLQRKYISAMIRDVHLIADVLVLIAGSDNFLRLVRERGMQLKKADDVSMMLGWFKDRDGEVRWGVEVVGGRDAVDWVDAPKTGWHVRRPSNRRLLPWGKRSP